MNEGKNFLNGKYKYLLHSIQNSFKKFKKFGFESDPYRVLFDFLTQSYTQWH